MNMIRNLEPYLQGKIENMEMNHIFESIIKKKVWNRS